MRRLPSNQRVETSRRPACPFNDGRDSGRAPYAPAHLSAAVAHAYRSATIPDTMKASTLIPLLIGSMTHLAFGAEPIAPLPAQPCDMVVTVSQFVIPRIDYQEHASLEEVLDFIRSRYDIEIDPPRPTTFSFIYRLSDASLKRRVTLVDRNITMIKAIKQALGDLPVVLTFEPGRLIFSEASVPSRSQNARIQEAEQGGAGQPATRSESKSEGGDQPQPGAEGRSR